MQNHNSLRIDQDASSRASILGVPVFALGGDKVKIRENVHDSIPQLHKALCSTGYTGKKMK